MMVPKVVNRLTSTSHYIRLAVLHVDADTTDPDPHMPGVEGGP